ncbi:MAG: serine/threonine-protein kinase, partial [Thermodesulfobacteriota bacterium]
MLNPGNLAGKNIDQFRLDEFIGQGSMGIVYKAFDNILKRTVALKLIPKGGDTETPTMAEARKRLIQEAQAAGRLSHPNIVTIHSYGETDEFQYICMEYITGKTLADMIEEEKIIPVEEAMDIIEQVLLALDKAHQEQIVHRDIKPSNIMVLPDKRAKVMDFGIAKIPSLSMTTTGTVLGTPYYMSPEQISGQRVDILSDIFSVGAVFFKIIN